VKLDAHVMLAGGHAAPLMRSQSTCYIVKALSQQKVTVKRETLKSGEVILMGGRCPEMAYIGVDSYP
jgi:hypothetical protein